jgi:hypothetical protein
VPDSGPFIKERERGVWAKTGIECEVHNLLMLISAHSMAEASYGNGSVSLDASGYQRFCSKDKEKAMWWI